MKGLAILFVVILLFAGVLGVVAKNTPGLLLSEKEEWTLLEKVEGCGTPFSDKTLSRVAEGGKFKILAVACSGEDEYLSLIGTATLTDSEGQAKDVTLFTLESDVLGKTHECVFEVKPAEGEEFSNVSISGMYDSVELYIYVIE